MWLKVWGNYTSSPFSAICACSDSVVFDSLAAAPSDDRCCRARSTSTLQVRLERNNSLIFFLLFEPTVETPVGQYTARRLWGLLAALFISWLGRQTAFDAFGFTPSFLCKPSTPCPSHLTAISYEANQSLLDTNYILHVRTA